MFALRSFVLLYSFSHFYEFYPGKCFESFRWFFFFRKIIGQQFIDCKLTPAIHNRNKTLTFSVNGAVQP